MFVGNVTRLFAPSVSSFATLSIDDTVCSEMSTTVMPYLSSYAPRVLVKSCGDFPMGRARREFASYKAERRIAHGRVVTHNSAARTRK